MMIINWLEYNHPLMIDLMIDLSSIDSYIDFNNLSSTLMKLKNNVMFDDVQDEIKMRYKKYHEGFRNIRKIKRIEWRRSFFSKHQFIFRRCWYKSSSWNYVNKFREWNRLVFHIVKYNWILISVNLVKRKV